MALTRWHELEESPQQNEFEDGYQGLSKEEKEIWNPLEKKIRKKNERESKYLRFRS